MAIVTRCDRCLLSDVTVTPVLGRDLCVACTSEFDDWVLAGQAAAVPVTAPRAGQGKRWEQARAVAIEHGLVTAKLLAGATGMQRTAANWYLHSKAKTGHLEFKGKGVFTLPSAEAAE